MRFKQWLEYTKRDIEYASLDASRAEISSQLKKKEDCFMIDTQLAPEAREAIRNAGFAAKPLSAADLSGLLNSDDSKIALSIYRKKRMSQCPYRRLACPTTSPPFQWCPQYHARLNTKPNFAMPLFHSLEKKDPL
ncbi:Uncharacterized protein HZ326_24898 [Fusarium oxysporum f. sp. albedinis]|nr:Uncharacterized protein HZ326_24898 [Fusarium oxysporum f. sp. albedinis]